MLQNKIPNILRIYKGREVTVPKAQCATLSPEEAKDEEGPCIQKNSLLSIKMKDITKSIHTSMQQHCYMQKEMDVLSSSLYY
jgi:hypothetical protein